LKGNVAPAHNEKPDEKSQKADGEQSACRKHGPRTIGKSNIHDAEQGVDRVEEGEVKRPQDWAIKRSIAPSFFVGPITLIDL
jgi:hypothetical protein